MFRLMNLFITLLLASSVFAQGDSCNSSECRYRLTLDAGAYIAVVTLPNDQPEGLWSLVINPSHSKPSYHNGFWAGSILKEQAELPGWIGFSLYKKESLTIIPSNWTRNGLPVTVQINKDIGSGNRALVYGPTLMTSDQKYPTASLEPGFYITELFTQPDAPRTYLGLAIEGNSLYGGVSGGWLDSYSGAGYAAFIIDSPTTIDFLLLFGNTLPGLGAGQPHLEIYSQHEDETRKLYWSAPLKTIVPTPSPGEQTPEQTQPEQPEQNQQIPERQPADLPIFGNFIASNQSLFQGDNPIQIGVKECAIDPSQMVVLRGKVTDAQAQPLEGVIVTIDRHPEYGQTLSQTDGSFSLAVNAELLTVNYDKEDYMPLQRRITSLRSGFAIASDVALVPRPPETPINQGAGGVTQVAGEQDAMLLFPQGTQATMVLPDCSVQTLSNDIAVRASEYTVGDPGIYSMSDPQRQVASQMPFPLPPGTGYTYALELGVDQATDTRGRPRAREVDFDETLPLYVDNFLNFPVGDPVPAGWYDRTQSAWIPSKDGRIVKILSVDNGLAVLDIDGSGQAASPQALAELDVTDEERRQIAASHEVGKTLWRVPIEHFSPWDCNWPFGPPEDAEGPNVPEGGTKDDDKEEDPCEKAGCIIEAENQVLGETIPVVGTPFNLNYRSSRVPGRKSAYTLDIPVYSAAEPLPASLQRVEVEVNIAGQQITEIYPKDNVPKNYTFVWDGKDAFGRRLQGQHQADVRVSYVYKGDYEKPAGGSSSSFGLSSGTVISGDRARQEIAFDKKYTRLLGIWDARVAGFGGLTLDIHHAYDSTTKTLYRGDGGQEKVSNTRKPSPPEEPSEEEEPQSEYVELTDNDIRITHCTTEENACGKVLVGAARIDAESIQWISPNAASSLNVNNYREVFGFTGPYNEDFSQSVDNQWVAYASSSVNINNPQPSGAAPSIGHFFAPDRERSFYSDDYYRAQLTEQKYGSRRVELEGEGVADNFVTPAITLDIQINGEAVSMNDASAHCVSAPADGEVTFTITPRVNNDLVATMGTAPVQHVMLEWCSNDSDNNPHFITESVTPNNFALTDYYHYMKVDYGQECESLLVSVNKTIELKATHQRDTQTGFVDYTFSVRGHFDQLKPAKWLGSHKTFHVVSLSDNTRSRKDFELTDLLYPYSEELEKRSTRADDCPFDESDDRSFNGTIASQDGGLLYQFEKGSHVETLDSLMGTVIYTFTYNDSGYLIKITDIDGDTTTIERDAENKPLAIVAPYGQRTTLALNANGYLASATNPANETHQLVYTPDGLLTQYLDPRGNADNFEYDALGLFVKNVNPINGGYTITRTDFDTPEAKGHITTMTTAEGRKTEYKVATVNGKRERTNTAQDGTITQSFEEQEGDKTIRTTTTADGTLIWTMEEPETRLVDSSQSSAPKGTAIVLPSGLKMEIASETITDPPAYADDYEPLNLKTFTSKVTVNGQTRTAIYDKTNNTITAISAGGRQAVSSLDDKGRTTKEQASGFADTVFNYDERGRLISVVEGEGEETRTATLSYDEQGNISVVTDALGRQISFIYDAVGRVTTETLPDGRQIHYTYDANGNVTSVTPPTRPAHHFDYDAIDQQTQYTPPAVGLPTPQTQYFYNLDEQLLQVVRPDSQTIDFNYDVVKGRLNSVNSSNGQYNYDYDATTGNLITVTSPDNSTLSYTYDGSLPLSVTWGNGMVNGTYAVTYDNHFRVTSYSINGGNTVNYQYDPDSLLTKAGELTLTYEPQNGLLTSTQLGNATTQYTFNSFAEMVSKTSSYSGNILYNTQYTRDKLGRITQKAETIEGVTSTYRYEYDIAGQLVKVSQEGAVTEQYTYDGNGNRLSANTPTYGAVNGSYDEQDRLLQYGENAYTYTANGDLLTKTVNGATTQYTYDVFGALKTVQLPDGTQIEYIIDASGRRIAKKVNGVLSQGFLYRDGIHPIAELDGNGNVVAYFVYASKGHAPDYMVKAGQTYRILSDHLGSPRLVIDISTGAIVQRMDYDAFGNVILDTNQGFQPFGFASGLYDVNTGLVRFGARDYDTETGRWTAKDPIDFASGSTNLYGYVFNDPVNFIDPDGEFFWVMLIGAAVDAVAETLIQLHQHGWKWECVDWGQVLQAALVGAATSIPIFKVAKAVVRMIKSTKSLNPGRIARVVKKLFKKPRTPKPKPNPKQPKGPCPNSFPAETLVHTENGVKAITEIQEGDKVLSFDEQSQTTSYQLVIAVIQHAQEYQFVKITLKSGETLEATGEHPFYVPGEDWIPANALTVGHNLRISTGQLSSITHLETEIRTEKVYNLSVANTHSYFVGTEGILVHNTGVGPCGGSTGGGGSYNRPGGNPPGGQGGSGQGGRGNRPPQPPTKEKVNSSGLNQLKHDTYTPGGGNPSPNPLQNPFGL